jgi:hypothetical protein
VAAFFPNGDAPLNEVFYELVEGNHRVRSDIEL